MNDQNAPRGYDATCRGCSEPFTFQNAQAVGANDWRNYCSKLCGAQAGTSSTDPDEPVAWYFRSSVVAKLDWRPHSKLWKPLYGRAQPANTDSVPGSPLGSGARPDHPKLPESGGIGVSSIGLGAEGEQ